MATAPQVTGDLMAEQIETLSGAIDRALLEVASHIEAGYIEPVQYQTALGKVARILLETRQPLREAQDIINRNNGKKQRYK